MKGDAAFVKARLGILLREASMGSVEAKLHAQTLVSAYGIKYGLPGAVEFYNALNNYRSEDDLDWSWTFPLDQNDAKDVRKLRVRLECDECCHRMLTAALYMDLDKDMQDAYLSLAADTCMDPLREGILRGLVGGDPSQWSPIAENILYDIDAELTRPVVSESAAEPKEPKK